jgi:hypothetical protein
LISEHAFISSRLEQLSNKLSRGKEMESVPSHALVRSSSALNTNPLESNGNGIAWLLADRKKSLKGKEIEKITVWFDGEQRHHLWATIK